MGGDARAGPDGYRFVPRIGENWITQPWRDPVVQGLRRLAGRLGVTLFLGHPEKDAATGLLHNAVLALSARGVVSLHRKICVVPGATEGWSRPGETTRAVRFGPLRVGAMVCADAYRPRVAAGLRQAGAQIIFAPSAWCPKPHGPQTSWLDRSRETGVPVVVCNRTGIEDGFSFMESETSIFHRGRRLGRLVSRRSSLAMFDWDVERRALRRGSWTGRAL